MFWLIKKRTGIHTSLKEPRTYIQKADALISNRFWGNNHRRPNRRWGLSRAIPEADLRKFRLLTPQSIVKERPAPTFQIVVANRQLESPKSTIELKFDVGDI